MKMGGWGGGVEMVVERVIVKDEMGVNGRRGLGRWRRKSWVRKAGVSGG